MRFQFYLLKKNKILNQYRIKVIDEIEKSDFKKKRDEHYKNEYKKARMLMNK